MSEDAGIEPRTVATTALAVRRPNHSARSNPLIMVVLQDVFYLKIAVRTYINHERNSRGGEHILLRHQISKKKITDNKSVL